MNWKPGAHGTTFGGNPVCIAAALATLDLIEERVPENAAQHGRLPFRALADWTKQVQNCRRRSRTRPDDRHRDSSAISGPRKKPATCAMRSWTCAFHKGLLVLGAGENTLRLSPPLLIDEEQADFAVTHSGRVHPRSREESLEQ